MKYTPRTKPFPHQARGTLRAARARNYALFFEPRLGKSKAALDYVGLLAAGGHVRRVVIVCPAIAKDVWDAEIRKHFPYYAHVESFDEEWAYPGPMPAVSFFICGREETFRRQRVRGRYVRKKQEIVEAWRPDVVIFDESHESQRAGGVTAQDLWRLIRRLRTTDRASSRNGERPKPWVLLLSGTPTPRGWFSLFPQFRIMDESIFGTSAADFKDRHVVYGVGRRRWTVLGYRRERELLSKIRAHSYSVSADEAGLANVASWQVLRVTMPEHAVKLYLELAAEFLAEWEGGVISAKNAGVRRLRLLQITGGFTTDGACIHRAKLEKLRGWAALLVEQGESLLVYSRFTAEVEACTEILRLVGFRTFRVDGQTSNRDKAAAIRSLSQRPKDPTAISFQYQAGSRAIDLSGAAETTYYSTPDGWIDYWQSLKRTQGPNQVRPVRYTHLVVPGSIDTSVMRSLRKKEDLHAVMMRNPKRFLGDLNANP